MKVLKWFGIVLGSLIVLLIAAAFILPPLYRDDIKAAADQEIAASLNADVIYAAENIGISLFRDFPRLTITTGQVGVFNREPFAGEYLFIAENIGISVNLWNLITGDQLRVSGIVLEKPDINIRYLKDGRANFDITKPSADTVAVADTSGFSFAIDHWEIRDGAVNYDDATIPFSMSLRNLQHTGNGDFSEKSFDLFTESTADSLRVTFDGTTYLSNKKVVADATIGISEDFSLFTFRENTASINDFAFGFDGWFRMNETSYDMDLSWSSKNNSFRSVLSLVPGMFTEDFKDLESSGTLGFSGKAKGTFSDTQLPGFEASLLVKEGQFKYPKLPQSVSNVAVDLFVQNQDGIMENTLVDLRNFHAEIGKNPIDLRLRIENLKTFPVKAEAAIRVNLAEITSVFPVDGLTLRGNFGLKATANGTYDSIQKTIPAIDASLTLDNGYAKSSDYPFAAEKISAQASVKNSSGKMSETSIDVSRFGMTLDGESFEASVSIRDLLDYTWSLKARGSVDLEKVLKIFPMDGLALSGKLKADISNSGKYSDLEAGRYQMLPASGNASLTGFSMKSADLPYAVSISNAALSFDPGKMNLSAFTGTVGKSDFDAKGIVTGYMGYLFGNNATLAGKFSFKSSLLDLNEFMAPEETENPADTAAFGVIRIPENIRFELEAAVKSVRFMDYNLSNATGTVLVENQKAELKNVRFGLLGGMFAMTGTYDTRPVQPLMDFGIQIDKLGIREAAENFSIVKKFAPIAGQANGNFNLDFRVAGAIDENFSPVLPSLDASGLIKVLSAGISGSNALSAISSLTALKNTESVSLRDVILSASIRDGRLSVKPFDVSLGGFKTSVSGSGGLDGSIDYALRMNVPSSSLGAGLSSMLTAVNKPSADGIVPLDIRLGGTFTKPKAELVTTEMKQQAKEALTKTAEEKGKAALQEVIQGGDVKSTVRNLLKKDSAKTSDSSAAPNAQKILEDKLKGLLRKRKKN